MGEPRGRAVRWAVALVLAAVLLVLGATPAGAHAELAGTEPSAGEVLDEAPAEIVLRFTEDVDPLPGGIRLVRSDGSDVGAEVGTVDGDGSTIRLVPGEALAPDAYVVAWRVTSADSHPVRGAFTFQVGDAGRDTAALVNRLLSQESGMAGAGAVLTVGRWGSYAGLLLVAGWCGLAALGRAALLRRRWLLGAAVLGAMGTAVMLAGQAVALRSSWSAAVSVGAWSDVVATRAGGWWGLRLALAVGLVAALAVEVGWQLVRRRAVAGVAAVAVCVVTSLGGHAQSGRWVAVGFAATVLHLAAAALWCAGLVTAVSLARRPDALGPFLRWFSGVALASVAALVLSGALNSARQVGAWSLVFDTDYGRLLAVKVVVVAAVVALALLSRRATQAGSSARAVGPVRAEVAGLVVVLLVTAVLVNQRPAIAERTATETAIAVVGERTVQVVLEPARTRNTALHVYLTSPRGSLDRADEITVRASLDDQDIGPLELQVFPAGPNHVTNPSLDLPLPGRWTFEVDARFGDFELVTFRTQLQVRR
ncbi:MAG: copper resistance protein CopC [Acidimicrobiia bacterium]